MLIKRLPLLLFLTLWPTMQAAALRNNINNQSDDFKRSGVDLDNLHERLKIKDKDFEASKEVFNSQFKGDKGSPNSREQEKERLSGLDADSLESRGKAAYNQNKHVKKIFIDYNEPGFSAHRENAMRYKEGAVKVMNKLEDELAKGGIDCKEDEGYLETEQEFYLGTQSKEFTNEQQFGAKSNRRARQGDAKYNKVICEQAKKSYSCNNKLKARCVRKGKNWHTHERREFLLSGPEIYHSPMLRSEKREKGIWFHYLHQDDDNRIRVKHHIANKLGISPDNINDDLELGRSRTIRGAPCLAGSGYVPVPYENKGWVYTTYPIKYTYREGDDICLEWDKKWEEKCSIK